MANEEDEKLEKLAESWQIRMCEAGCGSWDSDPQRVANFLQEYGNEKLGLNIPIDIDDITRKLRAGDAKIKATHQSLINTHNASSSSSSSSSSSPSSSCPGLDGRRLFITRELHKSDMSDQQSRLSMPCRQVDEGVLTAEELKMLRQKKWVEVEVVDPQGRKYAVSLRRTEAGTNSYSYAIGKPWNDIKKDNGFKQGIKLEVWALRGKTGKLSFHLTPHP